MTYITSDGGIASVNESHLGHKVVAVAEWGLPL